MTWRIVPDDDPDLSWLEQTGAEMGEGFEEQARQRLADYGTMWEMVGVVVELSWHGATLESNSLWGIESDSDSEYFETVAKDLVDEIIGKIERIGE